MVPIMVTNPDTTYCVNQMSTIEKSPWAPPRRASGYGTRGVQAISCRPRVPLRLSHRGSVGVVVYRGLEPKKRSYLKIQTLGRSRPASQNRATKPRQEVQVYTALPVMGLTRIPLYGSFVPGASARAPTRRTCFLSLKRSRRSSTPPCPGRLGWGTGRKRCRQNLLETLFWERRFYGPTGHV